MSNLWTEDEINILAVAYREGGSRLAHERLPHRTERAIRSQAHMLGISSSKKRFNDWSDEDVAILKQHYPQIGAIGVMQDFLPERTYSEIRMKAARLRLHVVATARQRRRAVDPTPEEIEQRAAEVRKQRDVQ